jgi:6-pyruvoyltetrahydropterin/6-carboxytetrahydropterin synthase
MIIIVTRCYRFESAHWLPGVPETHKCHRIHGHNYQVEISVSGSTDQRGFILEFAELDLLVTPLIDKIDHRLLNDIPGLENPTAELIAEWFASEIKGAVPNYCRLFSVRVYETADCFADVRLG